MSTCTQTSAKTCRLLYYGAMGAGKRDNLRLVNQSLPPQLRLSLASADPERQIAFSMNTEKNGQWQVLVQSVDAGSERFPTAGMDTTPPFDGIIFVVSSRARDLDQSLASLEGLKGYLDTFGLDLMNVPVVLQYNHRDADDMLPVDRLESLLNPWGLLSFPASSKRDEGIRETLKSILGLTVNHLTRKSAPIIPVPVPVEEKPPNKTISISTSNDSLGLEYGPPLPGSEIAQSTKDRSQAIFDELSPPVVIPVKIPRRLMDNDGSIRVLLEIKLID